MCYAAPGPRCSRHARIKLDKATHDLREAAATLDRELGISDPHDPTEPASLKRNFRTSRTHIAGLAEREGTLTASQRAAFDAYQKMRQDFDAAADAYDTTPAGIKALDDQMAALRASGGPDAMLTHEYSRLAGRRDYGHLRRTEQLAAYKDATGTTATPTTDTSDEDEPPVEPTPTLCDCIDYRFKRTCQHVQPMVENVRREYLPTGQETSLRLHAASAELRQAQQIYADARELHHEAPTEATEANRAAAAQMLDAARVAVQSAEEAFEATPAGQAYLTRRAQRLRDYLGYDALATNPTERLNFLRTQRTSRIHGFTALTGVAVDPASEAADARSAPPTIAYGNNRCPDTTCDDFAWTGRCTHTDTDLAAEQRLSEVTRALAYGDDYIRAVHDELGTGMPRRGLLSRLRKTQAPKKPPSNDLFSVPMSDAEIEDEKWPEDDF